MMQQKFRRYFFAIVFVLVISILITGCSSSSSTATPVISTGNVSVASVTDTVSTSGTVSAKQIATLTWGTSGNVLKVNVQNNDNVTGGQELMKLDSASASTDVLNAVSNLVTAKQTLEKTKNSTTTLAQAEVALVTAQSAYNDALKQYYSIDQPLGSPEYIDILQKAYLDAQRSTLRAYTQYNRFADLASDDPKRASAYAQLAQARINESDALIRLNHFSNPPTALEVAAINANLNLAKAQLVEAQNTYDQVKNGNAVALAQAQAAVDSAQTMVNKLSIFAPFNGQVAVVYSQVGDVVSQNSKALILVDRSQMYVNVLVDENSISKVKVGDSATVDFTALGIKTTGKVSLINPIGVVSANVVNYTVRVQLNKVDPKILVGATATVVITTGAPQDKFYVPVSAVLTDAQGEYVTVVNNDGSTARVSVVSGDIANEQVQVNGNLKKDELVELYTTTTSSTTTSTTQRGGLFGGAGRFLR